MLLCWGLSQPLWAEQSIYLLSPDAGSNTLQLLKLDFEKYLSKRGDYPFYPFNREEVLQEKMEGEPEAIVLMPAESYRKIFNRYRLAVVAAGAVNGMVSKRHLLVGRQGGSRNGLQCTVAMPFSETVGRRLLEEILGHQQAAQLEILTVPKGIDALMSVGFGMADLALTDNHGYEQVAKVNGRLVGLLSQLAEGAEQYNTVISMPQRQPLSEQMLATLMEMKKSAEGRRLLQFLKVEEWKLLTREEQRELERMQ